MIVMEVLLYICSVHLFNCCLLKKEALKNLSRVFKLWLVITSRAKLNKI